MFRWYQRAQVCYVYLADVSFRPSRHDGITGIGWQRSFRSSRWFHRGWTLRELLAPCQVVFYSREWECLGTKSELKELLSNITRIPISALDGQPLSDFPVDERLSWAHDRQTTEIEDKAYCLLGIFGVFMPLNYGERENAFQRLRDEIEKNSDPYNKWSITRNGVRSLGLCLTGAPLIQHDQFIGRGVEMDAIHNTLHPNKASSEQRLVVLGGIGGIGKTQLAIAYARKYEESYRSVLWLNATSELSLHSSLRSVAQGLIDGDQLERLDNEQVRDRIQQWLSDPHNRKWLLIFDNYDNPDDFNIDRFRPNIGHGSIIVTTRLPDKVIGSQLRMQPLESTSDSLNILQVRSGRNNILNDSGARRLVKRMSGLPLALVTAGAFLRKSTLSFQQYLEAYERQWQVDSRRPLKVQEYPDRTLYTTWNLTYSQLATDDNEAAQMLRLLAYFDHQEVWYELFQAGLADGRLPAWLPACLSDRVDFESMMGTLLEYCLVEVQDTGKPCRTYRMHTCVHDWTLGGLNANIRPQLYWFAFDCIAAMIDESNGEMLGKVQYNRLGRHGAHLTHHRFESIYQSMFNSSKRLDKAIKLAEMLRQQAQLFSAGRIYMVVLTLCEKALGSEHTATIGVMITLSAIWADQDKLDQAEEMCRRAQVACNAASGVDPTFLLKVFNNLGRIYLAQGRMVVAEQYLTLAFFGYDRLFGNTSPLIFDTIHNIGRIYQIQGRLEAAEDMYLRALSGYETLLGPKHPSTLETINNLGLVYKDQGRFRDAEEMFLRSLSGMQEILGWKHPLTLKMVDNLWLFDRDQETRSKFEAVDTRRVSCKRPQQNLGIVGFAVLCLVIAVAMWLRWLMS